MSLPPLVVSRHVVDRFKERVSPNTGKQKARDVVVTALRSPLAPPSYSGRGFNFDVLIWGRRCRVVVKGRHVVTIYPLEAP